MRGPYGTGGFRGRLVAVLAHSTCKRPICFKRFATPRAPYQRRLSWCSPESVRAFSLVQCARLVVCAGFALTAGVEWRATFRARDATRSALLAPLGLRAARSPHAASSAGTPDTLKRSAFGFAPPHAERAGSHPWLRAAAETRSRNVARPSPPSWAGSPRAIASRSMGASLTGKSIGLGASAPGLLWKFAPGANDVSRAKRLSRSRPWADVVWRNERGRRGSAWACLVSGGGTWGLRGRRLRALRSGGGGRWLARSCRRRRWLGRAVRLGPRPRRSANSGRRGSKSGRRGR